MDRDHTPRFLNPNDDWQIQNNYQDVWDMSIPMLHVNEGKPVSSNLKSCYVNQKRPSSSFDEHLHSPEAKRPCLLRRISFSTLETLLDKSPEETLTEMSNPSFRLKEFLNDRRMRDQLHWISIMTRLLEKITVCHEKREQIRFVFKDIQRSVYVESIYIQIQKRDSNTYEFNLKLITQFLTILDTLIVVIPHAARSFTKIFDRIELQFIKNEFESQEFKYAKCLLDKVLAQVTDSKQKSIINGVTNVDCYIDVPSYGYRQLPVVPGLEELLSEETPYLPKNIVAGSYENAEQYLDIHFRLLREDFSGPLRDGLRQYLTGSATKNMNIKIYENVTFQGSQMTKKGVVYLLKLDSKQVSKINWHSSKRLLHGNILVLSFNRLKSYTYVTVEERMDIAQSFTISVKPLIPLFGSKMNQINLDEIDRSLPFTILESLVFFEAYRSVLCALQKIPSDSRFPLDRCLLEVSNVIPPPKYITPTTTYDFTQLLINPNLSLNNQSMKDIDHDYDKVRVLEKNQWPTSEKIHLNEKQYEALIQALTQQVALIQGPPGTGKTYIGVRILEILWHNRSVWCPITQTPTPILIISYTNHALDQFLELVVDRLNITDDVLRVGSRCKNPKIQKFSLVTKRSNARENRFIPKHIFLAKREAISEKMQIEGNIRSVRRELYNITVDLAPLKSLLKYSVIHKRHVSSLLQKYDNRNREEALFDWLEVKLGDTVRHKSTRLEEHQRSNIRNYVKNKTRDDGFNEEDHEETCRRFDDDMDVEPYDWHGKRVRDAQTLPDMESSCQNTRKNLELIQQIIQPMTTLTDNCVQKINGNVWRLNIEARHDLYRYWLSKYKNHLRKSLNEMQTEYDQVVANLEKHIRAEDYYLFSKSKIIAMTSTCSAKYYDVLEKLGSKIVIVEEAAALFEAHIITGLSTSCEHLILIGDHVQLKPNPNVYRLATKHQLDTSLFERLINNEFPSVRLNIQHRMRPEIGRIMQHFYDDLETHHSLERNREQVRGLDSNLFFINHDHMETDVRDGNSYFNEFEANYSVELARYLIKQDYKSQQITILVMYLGQKQIIAKLARQMKDLNGIRIMVTDDYQGEENDIIILSLVRNNKQKNIGFLKVHNRICVALSRARCGLYVLGNFTLLAEVNETWKKIVTSVSETNQIGNGLSLCCRQHPENKIIADEPKSFGLRPEGGCTKICDARLPCGHKCELKCHNYDLEHINVVCSKICGQQLSCDHICYKRCHHEQPDVHSLCTRLVRKTIAQCGHTIVFNCGKTPTTKDCNELSIHRFHCGHELKIQCRIIFSPSALMKHSCEVPCEKLLACGHKCHGKCGDCAGGKLHVACKNNCERELICSHVCKKLCSMNCPPCSRDCETRCIHSRCKKKCGELCSPCIEPCGYKCEHLRCTRLCSEPCDRATCNEPCRKTLKCDHSCIGMCGELCPPQCRICNAEEVQEIFFGSEGEPDARFVFLPDCRHTIEVTALDEWIRRFENDSTCATAIRFPECPRCRQKIYRCERYQSMLNRIYESISQVKHKIMGNQSQENLKNRQKNIIIKYKDIQEKLTEIQWHEYGIASLLKLFEKDTFLYDDKLAFMENLLGFLQKIHTIIADGRQKLQEPIFQDLVKRPLCHMMQYLLSQKKDRNFTEQQFSDIQSELERFPRMIFIENLLLASEKDLNESEEKCTATMRHLVKKPSPFTNADQQEFDNLAKKLTEIRNLPGLGITDRERIEIVRALNIAKGHWFICPNGHPYVITECGGANQKSQCPDCREHIGGQNHQLLQSNRHFGLMDGSQHAAYSNEATLEIFRRFQ